MNLEIDKKLYKNKLKKPRIKSMTLDKESSKARITKVLSSGTQENISGWNFIYMVFFFVFLIFTLVISLADLQVVQGQQMSDRSQQNSVRVTKIPAYRGVVFDRNGKKLVENVPSINVYITIDAFLDSKRELDEGRLVEVSDILHDILGSKFDDEFSSIYEKVYTVYSETLYYSDVLIATDVDNDIAIEIKSRGEDLVGVYIQDSSKRHYIYPYELSHILGYVGEASASDMERFEYVGRNDLVGKLGMERYYNEYLSGISGKLAVEVDSLGRSISDKSYILEPAQSGKSLYLSLDMELQGEIYQLLETAVEQQNATGGSVLVQDVNTGELLALVSYPGYDSNLFVGGISQKEYDKLLNDAHIPLMNRVVAAQVPPGSTFKPLVAAAALDANAITTKTEYLSKRGYTFTSGAPFEEFRNKEHGWVNVVEALTVSSNIFFCEVIRNWDMNKLVPYLEKFGIGQYTGIDITGEMPGRLPSPDNKIELANTTSPWLEPVWYPEGDSCNSVIGQGITLVTPVQMVNWVSAIANGGTLHTPHLGIYTLDEEGSRENLEYKDMYQDIVSEPSLEKVREGMHDVVWGDRGTAKLLRQSGLDVSAKTGTAEFGSLDKDGRYENTHAWITGFYPYEKPEYSFVFFLEDGGISSDVLPYSKDMLLLLEEMGY